VRSADLSHQHQSNSDNIDDNPMMTYRFLIARLSAVGGGGFSSCAPGLSPHNGRSELRIYLSGGGSIQSRPNYFRCRQITIKYKTTDVVVNCTESPAGRMEGDLADYIVLRRLTAYQRIVVMCV
jgi:hypothetical protein